MAVLGGGGGFGGGKGDKTLSLPVMETLRLAWADDDLRARMLFVLGMFAVFCFGSHVPVPVPGVTSTQLVKGLEDNTLFMLINALGGGALRRVSVFALGLNPYITSSIILQILTTAIPAWKQELKEGGEYARRQQNQRTRLLSLALCAFQGWGFIQMMLTGKGPADAVRIAFTPYVIVMVIIFWTAGAMFMLWLGEQISERGIGNGVSLMIFAGITFSLPSQIGVIRSELGVTVHWWGIIIALIAFVATTWGVVYFTTAQRRIPVQHMRRMFGTRGMQGGSTSYLPLSVNTAGVIPIIFAVTLLYMPQQFASFFKPLSPINNFLMTVSGYLNPNFSSTTLQYVYRPIIGCLAYTALIFFFTYFYTAIQLNVEDIADNLKRAGSFIPGVRPGKQTKDFLDGVISRITIVGAAFLSGVALVQYIVPGLTGMAKINVIGGTTLLIMVSVALETMRQIEANLLMKQYGQ
jgi:preprotein translocase subunit SecY